MERPSRHSHEHPLADRGRSTAEVTLRTFIFSWLVVACGVHAQTRLFDMGTSNSVVAAEWMRVTGETIYSPESGFGWEHAAERSFDDPVPVKEEFKSTHPHWAGPIHNDVLRDGVEDSRPLTFIADVAPGRCIVSVTVGRYTKPRHDINVAVNGAAMATNVDCWGHVWGSQGGVPTRTISAVVTPQDGRIRLEFTCAQPRPDRWKEYAYKEPEGGRLWYLGENKNSVLAIRIAPYVAPKLQSNQGPLTNAIAAALAFTPRNSQETIEHASRLDWLAGNMDVTDRETELKLLRTAESAWRKVLAGEPDDPLATWRVESAQRLRMALEYLQMFAYGGANKKTGLRSYDRYWAAYDLCGAIVPEDPLYFKARLVQGRVAKWCGHEGHWKNCYDLAAYHFAELKKGFPAHPLVRLYTGEQVPSSFVYHGPSAEAPEWARLQHEALARYLHLIHYWVRHRQTDNGELGGGWGDDVEILRGWAPATLAIRDPLAMQGVRKLVDGLWNSGDITNGYSRNVDDVEHGAELTSDTQPLMCLLDYGDPVYLERCMATMRCMRDVWTAVNAYGHRHFKSHYFSATTVITNEPRAADVALNGRAVNPGVMLLWYNRHPEAQRIIGEWCQAWIEDAFRTDLGKPRGFVPGSIRFSDDRIGGYAEHWWQTRDYFSDFESLGYTATLWHSQLAMFAASGDAHYTKALRTTLDAVETERRLPSSDAPKGSAARAARVCDSEELADVFAKWRALTGNSDYDEFLKRRGSPYMRYLLTGELAALLKELRKVTKALSANLELSTSEVLFTDRVNLPGSEVLFEMMSGSLGTPTYYPVHHVTWEKTDAQVAALVDRASATNLVVQLYNFADDPRSIICRLWRLEPGKYSLRLGSFEKTITVMERGYPMSLEIPRKVPLTLTISQLQKEPLASHAGPDLALSASEVSVLNAPLAIGKQARLAIRVHNVGLQRSPATQLQLIVDGAKTDTVPLPALDAPLDLEPRHAPLELTWTPRRAGPHRLEFSIPPAKRERVHLNNSVSTELLVP